MTHHNGKLACWLCWLTACALTAAMISGCSRPADTGEKPANTPVVPAKTPSADAPSGQPAASADPASANGEQQQFAADPFKVPAGDTATLQRYLLRLSNWAPRATSDVEDRDGWRHWADAVLAAAEKVLADTPTDEQRKQAAELKLRALATRFIRADHDGQAAAEQQWRDYAAELAGGPDADLKIIARRLLLRRDIERLTEGHPDEADQLLAKLKEFLPAPDLRPTDFSTAHRAALSLELIERYDLARAAYEAVADRFKDLKEPLDAADSSPSPVSEAALRMLADAQKRLDLLGRPLVVTSTLLDQTPLDWTPYVGKVVLLHFWDSEHRRNEVANIRANYDKFHDRGFDVLAVSLDSELAHVHHFLDEYPLPWPILFSHDRDAAGFDNPLARQCGVNRLPLSILIGRDGKVISIAATGAVLAKHLEQLLTTAPAQETPKTTVPSDANLPDAKQPDVKQPDAKPDNELKLTGNPYLPGKRWTAEETADWLAQMREKPESIKKRTGFQEGLLAGAEKVLASDLPEKQKNIATLARLEALHVISLAGDKDADEKIRAAVDAAKDNQDPEVAAEARFQSLEQRLLQADSLKPDEQTALLDEVEKFFAKQDPLTRHSRLASATVHIINNIPDKAAANKQMKRFSPIFMKSKDQDLVRYGRKLGEAAEPASK